MKQLWIYDEYQWPSGSAFGQTVEGHPEYESIAIRQFTQSGTGEEEIRFSMREDYNQIVHAFLDTPDGRQPVSFTKRKILAYTPGKAWPLYVCGVKRTFEDPTQFRPETVWEHSEQGRHLPDLPAPSVSGRRDSLRFLRHQPVQYAQSL